MEKTSVRVILIFSISTLLINSICGHDIHKRMTIEELRNTFHVESHDLVPEYEVVHIHHITTRSIDSGSGGSNIFSDKVTFSNSADKLVTNSKLAAHSKISENLSRKFTSPERGHQAELRLNAFGRPLNLSLKRTEGLIKKTGLKVWTVEPNATAQHGVEYIEIPETNDEIGDIYQDEANEAAILLRNDEENGETLVEGSIGGSLVIHPIPTRLRIPTPTRPIKARASELNTPTGQPDTPTSQSDATNPPTEFETDKEASSSYAHPSAESAPTLDLSDDEMYLDQEDGEGGEVAIDTGLPIRRKKVATRLAPHIIYKKKASQDDHLGDYALMEPDHLAKRYRRKRSLGDLLNKNNTKSRSKREAPYIIYPEILVIVDYDGYRLHDGDNVKIKRYFVSFWNGVDLRYKLLKGPKIRISIAGIIISRGRDATPYLERNRVGRDAIDSAAALTDMGKYLFRERRLPVYDIAVAITKLDMCRRQYANDVCNRGTAGFAYVGGACVVNKRLEKVNSVAIIEDTGGFSGIIVAAHEVGHLLGAVHDGSPPPSYLGGPGAEKCRWEDGYIMSDLRHTERGFRWSPCSVASFHHFLNGDTATCLYNAPHEDDSLPRVLPGKLLSLDAQCRKDRGTSACFKDDRVCAQLFCFDAGSGYCVAYRPAAEGSPCGDGQYCLNGRCVAEHENIIPDYSQNTPSYIRRQDDNNGRPLFYEEEEEDAEPQTPPPQQYYQQQYTTQNPYQYQQQNDYSTTEPPKQYSYYSSQSPYYTTTKAPYYTTKNSYYSTPTTPTTAKYPTFQFGRLTYTTPKPPSHYYTIAKSIEQSTRNPYIGDYYNLRSKTTKSPYDFANFGRTTKSPYYTDEVNNNYLKRSYNTANYYGANSNRHNVTTFSAFRYQ